MCTEPQITKTSAAQDNQPHQFPDLLTESELIEYLRIPEVSKAKNYHNVIDNLKRYHGLPRIHISGQPLYPLEAIQEWIRNQTAKGK
ncbi:MAG: hypothetical protein GY869_03155 [Planctomycetes bacterium]|nr:hypothetical protein [Planctomycetota bacterium]